MHHRRILTHITDPSLDIYRNLFVLTERSRQFGYYVYFVSLRVALSVNIRTDVSVYTMTAKSLLSYTISVPNF